MFLVYLTSTTLGVFTVGLFTDYVQADEALARQLAKQNVLEPSSYSDLSGTIIAMIPDEERHIHGVDIEEVGGPGVGPMPVPSR